MGAEERIASELLDKVIKMYSEFMLRITEIEELVAAGSTLLVGFKQALEFLQRPSIEKTSELVESIIKRNQTKRLLSYVGAGCVNTLERRQSVSKLHTCQVGLLSHLQKAKNLLKELEGLVKNVTGEMQDANKNLSHLLEEDTGDEYSFDKKEMLSSYLHKPEVVDYAAMMAIVYSMVKQDILMQEKIVLSLKLSSSSTELETYNLMWSLHPFIDDDVMHQSWKILR